MAGISKLIGSLEKTATKTSVISKAKNTVSPIAGLFKTISNNSYNANRAAHQAVLDKQTDPVEQEKLQLFRKIASNTDIIIDLLKKQQSGLDDKGMNLSKLLRSLAGPALLAGIAGMGALAPEFTKSLAFLGKLTDNVKNLGIAAKAASTLMDASKMAKAGTFVKDTVTATKAAASAGGIGAGFGKLITTGKSLFSGVGANATDAQKKKALGKWGNAASAGIIAGRAIEGDTTGVALDSTSMALGNISGKWALPAKVAKTVLDVGIMGRDYYRWKSKDDPNAAVAPGTDEGAKESGSNMSSALGVGALGAGAAAAMKYRSMKAAGSAAGTAGESLASTGAKVAGKTALKAGAKGLGKLIPGVGLALGAYGAYSRAKDGDYLGATLEGLSGIASLVPGLGTAASLALQGGLAARDVSKALGNGEGTSNGIGAAAGIAGGAALAAASKGAIKAGGVATSLTSKMGDDAIDAVGQSTKVSTSILGKASSKVTKTLSDQTDAMQSHLKRSFSVMTKDSSEFFINLAKNPKFIATLGALSGATVGSALYSGMTGKPSVSNGLTYYSNKGESPLPASWNGSLAKSGTFSKLANKNSFDKQMMDQYSKQGLDKNLYPLLKSQVAAESNFNPNAVSHVGAFGLTQFMPATAKQYGVQAGDSKEAVDSQLAGQAKYMKYLLKRYKGDAQLALAAYNWGEGNVDSYIKNGVGMKGQPMPKETKDYVTKIYGNLPTYQNDFGGGGTLVKAAEQGGSGGMGGIGSITPTTSIQSKSSAGAVGSGVLLPQYQPADKKQVTSLADGLNLGGTAMGIASKSIDSGEAGKAKNEKENQGGAGGTGAAQVSGDMVARGRKSIRLADNGVDIGNLNPKFSELFFGMVGEYNAKTGGTIQVNSGYRSIAQQKVLREKYGNKAAEPGKSMHNYGLAIDINSKDVSALKKAGLLDKYKFFLAVPGEDWHLEQRDLSAAFRKGGMKDVKSTTPNLSAGAGDIPMNGENQTNKIGDDGDSSAAYGSLVQAMTSVANSGTMNSIADFMKKSEVYTTRNEAKPESAIGSTNGGQKAVIDREANNNGENPGRPEFKNSVNRFEDKGVKPQYDNSVNRFDEYGIGGGFAGAAGASDSVFRRINNTIGAGFGIYDTIQGNIRGFKTNPYGTARNILGNAAGNDPTGILSNVLSMGDSISSGITNIKNFDRNPLGAISTVLGAGEKLSKVFSNGSIVPDTSYNDYADKKVKELNSMDQDSKKNVNVQAVIPPTVVNQGKQMPQSKGAGEGLSAPLIVRNPDSIFREVAKEMMKASM